MRERDGEREETMQGDKIDAVFSVQRCGDGCECRGRLSLFRRCYQVKPPTTGCRHGDAMATPWQQPRCSTRKECNLARMRRPLHVS